MDHITCCISHISAISSDIFNHSLAEEDFHIYIGVSTLAMAAHVSVNMRLTDFLPIRNKYESEIWESPEARNRKVRASISAADIVFSKICIFLCD